MSSVALSFPSGNAASAAFQSESRVLVVTLNPQDAPLPVPSKPACDIVGPEGVPRKRASGHPSTRTAPEPPSQIGENVAMACQASGCGKPVL